MRLRKVYVCAPRQTEVRPDLFLVPAYMEIVAREGAYPIAPHVFPVLDCKPIAEQLLRGCEEVWVFGTTYTRRMQDEIEIARAAGIYLRWVRVEEVRLVDIAPLTQPGTESPGVEDAHAILFDSALPSVKILPPGVRQRYMDPEKDLDRQMYDEHGNPKRKH